MGAGDLPLLQNVQTGCGAHPASYSIGTGFLPGGKACRAWCGPLTSTHCRKLRMSGAIPLLLLYTFMASRGTTFLYIIKLSEGLRLTRCPRHPVVIRTTFGNRLAHACKKAVGIENAVLTDSGHGASCQQQHQAESQGLTGVPQATRGHFGPHHLHVPVCPVGLITAPGVWRYWHFATNCPVRTHKRSLVHGDACVAPATMGGKCTFVQRYQRFGGTWCFLIEGSLLPWRPTWQVQVSGLLLGRNECK